MLSTGAKILCRTIGATGVGFALYDAIHVAGHEARAIGQASQENYLERAYFNSRTTDNLSFNESNFASKTFDARTKNPLPKLWGNIKGATTGFVDTLGNNIVLVGSSALALLCKGFMAKVGVAGVIGTAIYTVARQGFGLGKDHPFK